MSQHANNDLPCSSATAAVRAGIDRDTAYGAVTPPIVPPLRSLRWWPRWWHVRLSRYLTRGETY